jgi:hypothetical protein
VIRVARSNRSSRRSRRATTAERIDPERKTGTAARVVRAGEVATAVGAIVGLIFLVGDRMPWSGDDGAPAQPPRVLQVTLSGVDTDQPVRFGRFLRTVDGLDDFKEGALGRGLPPAVVNAQLGMPGVEVTFDLQIHGPPGRRLELTPRVYKAHGRIAADMPPLAVTRTEHYWSEASKDRSAGSAFAFYPQAPGVYYVELRMDEVKGKRRDFVARERTEDFRVLAR